MNKPDSVDAWLEQLGTPAADRDYRPGHARMHTLLQGRHLHRPKLRIRIAGTNGKGSTAFMLAAALQRADLSTGLYTSPHIICFNERIRINGVPAASDELLATLQEFMPIALRCGASYFEVATALALYCFSAAGVDVEILEAGVGGRLDATTAVPADMALITPIALDHQAWLGSSLADIASEKACAMDGCAYAISAPQSARVVDELLRRRSNLDFTRPESGLPELRAAGRHQQTNATLALAAVSSLREHGVISVSQEKAMEAIARTEIPARLQCVRWRNCRIWLDAAHNTHAVETLLPSLPELADPFDIIFLFTREDRDLREALPMLRPYARRLVGADRYGGVCDAGYTTLELALDAELNSKTEKSCLILGSFLTVSAAARWLEEQEQPPD